METPRQLQLKRPLVVFDIESTGLDIMKDRIVELSYIKVFPDGSEEQKCHRINPQMAMPEEAYNVHHISNNDLKDCPKFRDLAPDLLKVFEGCDLAGFNAARFDLPLLCEEFARAGIRFNAMACKMVDVQTIFHKKEPRNLAAAYRFYCHSELEGAHGATADTRATYEVLKAQLQKYDDLQTDVDWLASYTQQVKNVEASGRLVYNNKNEIVFNFGKYKGRLVTEVFQSDPGYYDWMMKGDFAESLKCKITEIRLQSISNKGC